MNCKEFQENIIFYLENDSAEAPMKAHIQSCPDCFHLFVKVREDIFSMDNEKEMEITPFFYSRLKHRMTKKKEVFPAFARRALIPAMIMAAGIFVGTLIGSVLTPQTVVPQVQNTVSIDKDFFVDNDNIIASLK